MILCEAVKPVSIPLDEIVRAQVRTVNTGASVFNTFAGVLLVAGALALDFALDADDDEFDPTDSFTVDLALSFIDSAPDLMGEAPGRPSNKAILGMMDAFERRRRERVLGRGMGARRGPAGRGRQAARHARQHLDRARAASTRPSSSSSTIRRARPSHRTSSAPCARMPPPSRPRARPTGAERDIRELVAARDGICWRTAGGDPAPGEKGLVRDEISLTFPRPKGARRARLIVGVSNTAWRSEFAREVLARTVPSLPAPQAAPAGKPPKALRPADFASPSGYKSWEFTTLRVRVMTVLGWQTGQVLFAVGPRPAEDMIYDIDLSDIPGDKVRLRLSPPAGYWLIDHLALDFGRDAALETAEIAPEAVDGPDAAEVLKALAGEDATTFVLYPADPPSGLTFTLPPPKEGMERTVFLRTVSCYEMPPKAGPKTGSRGTKGPGGLFSSGAKIPEIL